ncbi:MAG: hypothetical protein KKC20_11745 [Proteobacteria bacterium]|nr:hypothetical protein [Pseudomonadota bacterium]
MGEARIQAPPRIRRVHGGQAQNMGPRPRRCGCNCGQCACSNDNQPRANTGITVYTATQQGTQAN